MTVRTWQVGTLCTILGFAGPLLAQGDFPNDPDFPLQWALRNVGQEVEGKSGTPGADIAAQSAWAVHAGGSLVVVAIVSAGVDPHPEFSDRLLEGHVTALAGGDPYSTLDTAGQGTRLAGLIAAGLHDGVGIAGLNPHATILPVRAIQGTLGAEASAAEGIVWAADHGADIVLVPLQFYDGTTALADAVQYAATRNVLVIAPAGDQGDPEVAFPAAHPGCMAVSALSSDDTLAPFSNYGDEVDLSAPSENIWSTARDEQYAFESRADAGFAAAYVAGAAALVWSYAPHLQASQVRQLLLDSADDLGAQGWDPQFGSGRLNVAAAIKMAQPPPLRFELLDALPDVLRPNQVTSAEIRIADGSGVVDPTSPQLVYRALPGGVGPPVPLRWLGDDLYAVDFPALSCGVTLEYYLAASTTDPFTIFEPRLAPTTVRSAVVTAQETLFEDDFETDLGWTVVVEGGSETTGAWTRVEPVGTFQSGVTIQPEYDRSPDFGEMCFVTGQHFGAGNQQIGAADVDGGPVRLLSPVVPLVTDDVQVSYAVWVHSSIGETDTLLVEFSRDGGGTWHKVEEVSQTGGWQIRSFDLVSFPEATGGQLRLMFSIADLSIDSLTEAGIDEVRIVATTCDLLGDSDGDGDVDSDDARQLAQCLTGPGIPREAACTALDANGDGDVDLADVAGFQAVFGTGIK